MAATTFTDRNISDTYKGILHAKGDPLPASGQVQILDGTGGGSALKLGRSGKGATFSGLLSSFNSSFTTLTSGLVVSTTMRTSTMKVGTLTYPNAPSTVGNFVVQGAGGTLAFANSINTSYLENLSPNPSGMYKGISAIRVNSKGLVTAVELAAKDRGGDRLTTTSTTYFADASTPIAIITPQEYYTVPVALLNVPETASIAIMYIVPRDTEGNIGELCTYRVFASPGGNGNKEYPITREGVAQSARSHRLPYASGTQFLTRISKSGLPDLSLVYFRCEASSERQTRPTFNIHLIGYQE